MQESAFRKNLSRAVRLTRKERGLTQRALAHRSGITEKYLSRIELGLVTPSALVVFRLCTSLGADFSHLVTSRPTNEPEDVSKIVKLLRGRSNHELDCARRVLMELFR